MPSRNASDVAKRCLCLELLLQRLGLELDDEDPLEEREAVRRAWLSRLGQLGLEEAIQADERALLERPVEELSEEECENIEDRVIGALVLLWAMNRLGARPTGQTLGIATRLIAEHGILGDGSIPEAKKAIESASLRPLVDLQAAAETYGKATTDDTDRIVADIGKTTLEWIFA